WTEFVKNATELRPELGGRAFDRPSAMTTVEIDAETGQLASASCTQRERVALAPNFVPDHECSIHGDPWGLKALAASSSASDALTTTTETEAHAPVVYDSTPRALYTAQVETTAPRETYGQANPTRVETGRDGRRRLTNDMSVAPKNSDEWQE
ncbi:MAG: hypothetical protein ACJ74Q_22020, partial [Pyrinomonadaceae bacterium]